MRNISGVLAVLLLTACSGNSDIERTGGFLFNSITGSNVKVSRERAAAVPYATMGLQLGQSTQALLILGATEGDELDWFAGDNIFVATNHGQVVRTVGLPYDLGGRHPINASSIRENKSLATASMDFPDLGVFGATSECSSRNMGEESVEILGAPIPTLHVIEHCNVPALKWTFDNDFWKDRTSGYIWRSRQYIHPKSPPIILEVFRPEQNRPNSAQP
jgi:hypothetical protein